MIEYQSCSADRGTDTPFEHVDADGIHGAQLAGYLYRRTLPGVRVYPTRFRPQASYFARQSIEGLRFVITDREALNTPRARTLRRPEHLYGAKTDFPATLKLIGLSSLISFGPL